MFAYICGRPLRTAKRCAVRLLTGICSTGVILFWILNDDNICKKIAKLITISGHCPPSWILLVSTNIRKYDRIVWREKATYKLSYWWRKRERILAASVFVLKFSHFRWRLKRFEITRHTWQFEWNCHLEKLLVQNVAYQHLQRCKSYWSESIPGFWGEGGGKLLPSPLLS